MIPLLMLCFVVLSTSQPVDYTGYHLISFSADQKLGEWLQKIEDTAFYEDPETGDHRVLLDVFSEPTSKKPTAVVLVAPQYLHTFKKSLYAMGVRDVVTLNDNVQKDLNEMPTPAPGTRIRRHLSKLDDFNIEDYHSYDAMVDFMRKITEEYPQHTKLIQAGKSFEGRTLYGVKIFRPASIKPAIFIDAGVHAREWIAPASALYVINELATKYGIDERITKAVEKFDWHIMPQVNPDGYEYSMSVDRLWRKTRSRNTTANKWCFGADANRNWGYRWGEAGSNRSPCSNIYGGAFPFSEPEAAGLKEYITWSIPQLTVYISLHSYGQVLLSPWGYTNQKPQNYPDQKKAAKTAVDAIKNTTGAVYTYGTISELMYPASGTSIDWMQNRGVPYIYGIELRPGDSSNNFAFSLPPTYIKASGEEMSAAFLALAEYAVIHQRL